MQCQPKEVNSPIICLLEQLKEFPRSLPIFTVEDEVMTLISLPGFFTPKHTHKLLLNQPPQLSTNDLNIMPGSVKPFKSVLSDAHTKSL
jgi:hypothetical protein